MAFAIVLVIVALIFFVKYDNDEEKRNAHESLYRDITPVPVKVNNPFELLRTEPSGGFAECVGTCNGPLTAATSVMQQGEEAGWVRLIARYPHGVIKGWLSVYSVERTHIPQTAPQSQPRE